MAGDGRRGQSPLDFCGSAAAEGVAVSLSDSDCARTGAVQQHGTSITARAMDVRQQARFMSTSDFPIVDVLNPGKPAPKARV